MCLGVSGLHLATCIFWASLTPFSLAARCRRPGPPRTRRTSPARPGGAAGPFLTAWCARV
jgi:hypothetical protein